jgi:CheY-like chemotaxis protein
MGRILVIEDERLLLRDIVELLEFSDFEVNGAASGEEGLALAYQDIPMLILCDISLRGELDGFRVLDEVRSAPALQHVPFVFMSARADPESKLLGLDKGANEYLTKPFAAADLIETVSRLLAIP